MQKRITQKNQRLDFIGKKRVYLRCLKCSINISIHDQQRQSIVDSNSLDKDRLIMITNHLSADKAFKQCELEIKTLNIRSYISGNLQLYCRKCSAHIGIIINNQVGLYASKLQQIYIHYKILPKQLKNRVKVDELYDNVRAFTTLSNYLISQRLNNIKIDKISKINQQLESFIKFYRQWENRKSFLSTKKSMVSNLSIDLDSLCENTNKKI